MTARDKTKAFTSKSDGRMRDEAISEPTAFLEVKPSHAQELAATSERFATTLRTASVETGPRESRSARFIGGEHLLWTAPFESEWHRHIVRTNPSTIH